MRYFCSLHNKEIKNSDDFLKNHPEAIIFKEKGYISSPYIRNFDNRRFNVILPLSKKSQEDVLDIEKIIKGIKEKTIALDMKCPICGFIAKSPVGLIKHIKAKHKGGGGGGGC